MNNNELKFDPMTGQPIQNNINNTTQTTPQIQQQNIQTVTPIVQTNNLTQQVVHEQTTNTIESNNINNLQSIPTVDQSQQQFINNTQSLTTENKIEKKQGINWTFLIILFIIILGAIFFLFPLLQKNL